MQTTDKRMVHVLVALCVEHGVKNAVFSPGSRNAPLVMAFNRESRINCQVIVDERSAAFFALGEAQQSGDTVVLICTSGTALLNYAPAIAEAYYQQVPLIIISADRPEEWIDQDDSQTIRQYGTLDNIVKKSYNLSAEIRENNDLRYVNRQINEAFIMALSGRKAPVHINFPLREPLYGVSDFHLKQERVIRQIRTNCMLEEQEIIRLSELFNQSRKIMILVGFMHKTEKLGLHLSQFSNFGSVAVLAELIANVSSDNTVSVIEGIFSSLEEKEMSDFQPDLLISFGGALVSKSVKQFLRKNPPSEHWHLGKKEWVIDTFGCLTNYIDVEPDSFFSQIFPFLHPMNSNYKKHYKKKEEKILFSQQFDLQNSGWSDKKVFSLLMNKIPENSDLHLSNGMSVRLAQNFKLPYSVKVYANRGTSGIDGSTSTAVGSAFLNSGITTLISGDLSFLYDSNALWNEYLSPRLKMIVINNRGGGIFREMNGPSGLLEMQKFFETPHRIDFSTLAELYHLTFFRATDEISLELALHEMYKKNDNPFLLEIILY